MSNPFERADSSAESLPPTQEEINTAARQYVDANRKRNQWDDAADRGAKKLLEQIFNLGSGIEADALKPASWRPLDYRKLLNAIYNIAPEDWKSYVDGIEARHTKKVQDGEGNNQPSAERDAEQLQLAEAVRALVERNDTATIINFLRGHPSSLEERLDRPGKNSDFEEALQEAVGFPDDFGRASRLLKTIIQGLLKEQR